MNLYQSLYDLLNTYVYGGTIAQGSFEELVAILFATLGCLLLVVLPFVVIYRVITRFI